MKGGSTKRARPATAIVLRNTIRDTHTTESVSVLLLCSSWKLKTRSSLKCAYIGIRTNEETTWEHVCSSSNCSHWPFIWSCLHMVHQMNNRIISNQWNQLLMLTKITLLSSCESCRFLSWPLHFICWQESSPPVRHWALQMAACDRTRPFQPCIHTDDDNSSTDGWCYNVSHPNMSVRCLTKIVGILPKSFNVCLNVNQYICWINSQWKQAGTFSSHTKHFIQFLKELEMDDTVQRKRKC